MKYSILGEAITLQHPININENKVHQLHIRPLNGYDEEYLQENSTTPKPILIAGLLLKNITHPVHQVTPELVNQIVIGDKNRLLLAIRKRTLGETIDCVNYCSRCNSEFSFELQISQLLSDLKTYPETFEITIDTYELTLRSLTVGDLIEASKRDHPIDTLNKRCIIKTKPLLPQKIPEHIQGIISEALEQLDPMAEIPLDLICPECGYKFTILFDPETYFLEEFRKLIDQFYREVFLIAINTQWNKDAILSLPVYIRKNYITQLYNIQREKTKCKNE